MIACELAMEHLQLGDDTALMVVVEERPRLYELVVPDERSLCLWRWGGVGVVRGRVLVLNRTCRT